MYNTVVVPSFFYRSVKGRTSDAVVEVRLLKSIEEHTTRKQIRNADIKFEIKIYNLLIKRKRKITTLITTTTLK